ncbi:hypothetical protein FRX31_007845 [Thalictrum thalictroides]|uniref:Uncharacterized protein n=1 Tax=Thalictrum thalictroides TaxID=46969 RepID=A0A7J6WYQ1_THATH|nr:hypothetical protein FRX31_007845 [Thalictrum thalictroides]
MEVDSQSFSPIHTWAKLELESETYSQIGIVRRSVLFFSGRNNAGEYNFIWGNTSFGGSQNLFPIAGKQVLEEGSCR